MRDPNKNTKFSFFCYEHESIDLKIRLRYDGLKQSEFFRSLLLKYINKDPVMLRMVHDIKQEQSIMGKNKLKKTQKDYDKSDDILKQLGITEDDKNDIFDIIGEHALDE
tara:strand:- start:34 stop:360 length:327 start_codon:yes stop_codon:yes gene_type:complete